MKKPWYSPSSFLQEGKRPHIGADKIEWIIENYEVLIDGRWPQKSSGYIDNPFAPPAKGTRASAYFETPMEVLSEFHLRVAQCGRDGDAFLCIRCKRYEWRPIIRLMRIRHGEIDRILERVFVYIVGRRKDRPYTEFIRHYSPRYRGGVRYRYPPFEKN